MPKSKPSFLRQHTPWVQRAPDTHPPALVVGYGTPHEHAFAGAVARLTAVLAESV